MIRRYSREAMCQIWTEENKFSIWLQIEILACEARKVPAKDLATIKRRAKFDVERIRVDRAYHQPRCNRVPDERR
jgi:adenylosuccinate lyase